MIASTHLADLRERRWRVVIGLAATVAFASLAGCGRETSTTDTAILEAEPATFEMAGRAEAVESERGMVVSGHLLASQAGAAVLARGGTAIDAAVTVGFSLAAVLPRAGNIGGGGFLVYRGRDGEVRTLDYRETAPAAASRDMYLGEDGEPTEQSVIGHRAAGVPGSVAGLWEMHRELGTLPWRELVEPAIELARSHRIDQVRSEDIQGAAERLARFPASAAQFMPEDRAPRAGEEFRQPDLARTLEIVAEQGQDGFYEGEVAELIVAEMQRGDGLITREDLSSYRAIWREPIEIEYHDYTLYTMPPPSSGGITVGLILNILEGFRPLPAAGTPEMTHLEAEAMRRAFVDRNRYLGDPDFVEMPLERLVSQGYADTLAATIDRTRATPTVAVLSPAEESSETTHYSIVDGAGNAVAITTTINGSFGNMVTVAGAGFLLNNEMDDFAAVPGKPNMFGLVQGEANAIEPGKRMLSSMTPVIVVGNDGVELVAGSPGGATIITTVYQVLANVLDHGMSLVQAVEAPRVHHQSLPDRLFFEHGGLAPDTIEQLEAWGHTLEEREGMSGNVSAISRLGESWRGVADPRRQGAAAAPP